MSSESLATEWNAAAERLEALRTRPAGTSATLDPAEYGGTVATWVARWATERPTTVAIHYYGRNITFDELNTLADSAAGWLTAKGVKPGDRVGLFMSNCPQYLVLFVAIMRVGAVLVPVNPMFRAADFTYEMNDSTPKVLVAQTELKPVVEASWNDLHVQPQVVYTALGDMLHEDPVPAAPFARSESADEFAEIMSHEPLEVRPHVDPTSLAALNYTGGTTGLPKGCEHTHEHMVYTAVTMFAARGTKPGENPDVFLNFLPVFWIAGEDAGVLYALVGGCTVILLNRYHPQAVAHLLESQKATAMVAPADVYHELLTIPGFADRAIAMNQCLAVSFVRKLDVDLRTRWHEATGSVLCEAAYGMTETHTMDTSTFGLQDHNQDLAADPIYTGYPVPGTRIVVVDTELRPVPAGQPGQILVNSPSILRGYFNNEQASAASLVEGWLLTGDTGRFDEHGALTYLARTKEMIKVNGMSVFPGELEAFFKGHPAVERVAVAPREDDERGQVPVAFIERAPGSAVTADELVAWAKENIASYKVPEIAFVDGMPMTATGKIRKVELVAALKEQR